VDALNRIRGPFNVAMPAIAAGAAAIRDAGHLAKAVEHNDVWLPQVTSAVEAMGLGCPAVVSDAGALPDVVGPAGLIFPVGDVEAMAEAVGLVLDDPDYADGLRRLGRLRAAEFDVEIAAARLAEVYREMVDTPRS
jgi:glycosyltransferase involved in cell wall biosynthesis